MNNQLTLHTEFQSAGIISSLFEQLAIIYSGILEEEVSVSKTRALVNVQCAFFAVIMPIDLGYVYRILALVWFVISLLRARQAC